jgi:transposase
VLVVAVALRRRPARPARGSTDLRELRLRHKYAFHPSQKNRPPEYNVEFPTAGDSTSPGGCQSGVDPVSWTRDELRRLRREIRQLREERAILSKAAAWFARETNTIPFKDSSS